MTGVGDAGAPTLIRIDHDPLPDGPTDVVARAAVRAVIGRGTMLLMVHSKQSGDYKFPGGGPEPGETPHQTVVREVSEECGRTVTQVGPVVVVAVERRPSALEPAAIFRMESTYHLCQVGDGIHDQRLDDYERELDFQPEWVALDAAIEANERALASGSAQTWVRRETEVLRALRERA